MSILRIFTSLCFGTSRLHPDQLRSQLSAAKLQGSKRVRDIEKALNKAGKVKFGVLVGACARKQSI
jgi:hypothetical protein